MTRFELQKRALLDLASWSQERVAFCCIVEPSSGIPNEEVRNASSKLFDSLGERLCSLAMVIEGTGFRSALVRSVASGIVMVMGKRALPVSYLATVREGADWLRRGVDLDAIGDFESAVESIRTVLDTQ